MHHNIQKLALEFFLRRGIHIKAENEPPKETREQHSTPYYIWRTQGDSKVRSRHAERNGKIFSWDNPPEGGHPGEDYNCRCWAEAIDGAKQTILTSTERTDPKWGQWDLLFHYYYAKGLPLTLTEIGHLSDIIAAYEKDGAIRRLNLQIIDEARKKGAGDFKYLFGKGYSFHGVSFSHGGSVVRGSFRGNVSQENGFLIVSGNINFHFSDIYTDLSKIREWWFKEDLSNAPDWLVKIVGSKDQLYKLTEFDGDKFPITGEWQSEFRAIVRQ